MHNEAKPRLCGEYTFKAGKIVISFKRRSLWNSQNITGAKYIIFKHLIMRM